MEREKGAIKMKDVAIIGAGPAGLAAATVCRQHDLDVTVIDEFSKSGGRLLGRVHEEPTGEWRNGIKEATGMTEEAKALHTELRLGLSVHHIEKRADSY